MDFYDTDSDDGRGLVEPRDRSTFCGPELFELIRYSLPANRLLYYVHRNMNPNNFAHFTRKKLCDTRPMGNDTYRKAKDFLISQRLLAPTSTRSLYMINPSMIYQNRLSEKSKMQAKFESLRQDYIKREFNKNAEKQSRSIKLVE